MVHSSRGVETKETPTKVRVEHLNFYYGAAKVLHDIAIGLHSNQVSAFIGPSGCGKSTFLRTLNRMNDIIPGTRVEGEVLIDGKNIYGSGTDVVDLRRRVGMVFQKSNPFPKSIFENVAYGIRINGLAKDRSDLSYRVEESLAHAALWDEVKDRLNEPALALSGELMIEWGGGQRWLCSAMPATAVRDAAAKVGGHATLFVANDKSPGVFAPLQSPLDRIHREVKKSFDPSGIFNPGRLYPGL